MLVFLNGVADIERFARVDVVEILTFVEGYAVKHFSGCVVDKFKFDMLQMAPNEFACAEVHYTPGTEYRLLVSGAEWIEFSKQADELRGYLGKCQHRIDFLLWLELSGKYVVGHEFLKSASKFRDILFFQGQPYRVGVASEVFQQIAT